VRYTAFMIRVSPTAMLDLMRKLM